MVKEFEGTQPIIDIKAFIADGAIVIGKVTIKEFTSVWFNTVVRGDVNRIEIGRYCNVQDGSVIHVADSFPTCIGDFVSIGHQATLHGCTIENNCLIGIGAIVLNGAIVGEGSIIAAGALVREKQVIPPHSLVAGIPGKIIKSIPDDWERIHTQAVKYKSLWTERYGLLVDGGGECYHGEKIV
jgi:carbonic anhydrase/acetyltransferase-like protein (isoleucine patch superfamily)